MQCLEALNPRQEIFKKKKKKEEHGKQLEHNQQHGRFRAGHGDAEAGKSLSLRPSWST